MYLIILILMCVAIIAGMHYRKEDNRRMFGDYKLFCVCGLSMWIVDKISFLMHDSGKRYLDYKLKKIYTKDQVHKESYKYFVKKVSVSIVCFTGVIVFALLFTVIDNASEDEFLKTIKRPESMPAEYDIEMNDTKQSEKVHVTVAPVKYRKKEIYKKFEVSYDSIIKVMLGKNESLDKVKEKLFFPDVYDKEDINLEWNSSSPEIIDYDGNVYCTDEERDVIVYLNMNFQGVERDYEIPVKVLKKEFYTSEERLQKIIDSQDVYKSEVRLPEQINGKKVMFEKNNSEGSIPFLMIAIVAAIILFFLKDKDIDNQVRDRDRQLEMDYSEVVSKIMMLNNAGMSTHMAFKRIIDDYDKRGKEKRYVYEEMRLCENKINSGCSEAEAYGVFGRRCGLQCYIKLGSILAQSVTKGTKGTGKLLAAEVSEALENKKNIARKNGEEAGTKMLFPMVIMLMVAIVMIVVPAFMSIG